MNLIAFGASLLTSFPLVYAVRDVAIRLGRVAKPRADRWHKRPTALLGGVGIFIAFWLGLLAYLFVTGSLQDLPWGILLGSTIIFLLGLYDDLREMSPPAKLAGQILAAAVVIAFGYTTAFFTPRIPNNLFAQIPNIALTFFWLVGITNAINLLDNMDGLAGGIALITALFLSYFFWDNGDLPLLIVATALVGALVGFLAFNFPPASIFMGDSGSLFLGFTLASLAIARRPQASNVFAVMAVPTLLFLLPILDTTLVTFTRLLRGQSPAQGGRDHTSHRLIAFGLTERQAVLVLYGVALLSGLAGVALEALSYWLSLVLVPIVVISLALLTAYLGRLKVVVSSTPGGGQRTLVRVMLEWTLRRRLLEVMLDLFLIGIAYYLAFLTRYGINITPETLQLYLQSLPVAVAGCYLSFFTFGVYRGVWRYVGVEDLLRFFQAALAAVLLVATVLLVFFSEEYSPAIFLLFLVYLFLGLAASRSSFRILDRIYGRQSRAAEQRVLICGADDAGELALRWILMNPQLAYRPVGFLDPDPFMGGRVIHGVQVLGGLEQLAEVMAERQVDGVILTPGAEEMRSQVVAWCIENDCWVRSLRLEFELLE